MKINDSILLIATLFHLGLPYLHADPDLLPETMSTEEVKIPAPDLKMEEAIALAKQYVAKNDIKTEGYYLKEVKHIRPYEKDRLKSVWHVRWRKLDLSLGTDISLFVKMDGTVKRMPTM